MVSKFVTAVFLAGLIFINLSFSAFSEEKSDAESKFDLYDEESKLINEVKIDPKSSNKIYNLGMYYLNLAVDFDTKYLWGTPRKLNENQENAISCSIKAIDYLEKGAKIDTANATLLAKISEAYGIRMRNGGLGTKLKYMDDFNSNLKRALEIDPNNFEALITTAYKTLYAPSLFKDRNKTAKEKFEKLLEKYPDNPDVTKGLAISYDRLGDHGKALEFITKSLEVNSKDLESIALKQDISQKISKQKEKKG